MATNPSNRCTVELDDLLSLYWNYYELHANQRMKVLELFIGVETVLFGVFATGLSNSIFFERIISLSISLIGLLCFLLNKRTTDLLHQCRVAIRTIENNYMRNYSNDLKLFSKIKQSDGMLNYSQIIRKIYLSKKTGILISFSRRMYFRQSSVLRANRLIDFVKIMSIFPA